MPNVNNTEEEMMGINSSFELHRKAMIRAAKDNRHNIDVAGKCLYILERTHEDNLIHRWISTTIAVSAKKEELIAFCKRLYNEDIEFDEHNRTKSFDTDMGLAYFKIKSVAYV